MPLIFYVSFFDISSEKRYNGVNSFCGRVTPYTLSVCRRKWEVTPTMTMEEMDKDADHVLEQHKRLNKALRGCFYMEALYIEQEIIEDYTELVLKYSDQWSSYMKKRRGHEPVLDSKIRHIQTAAMTKKTAINRLFGDDLLDRVLEWKTKRHKLILSSLKQHLTVEYVEAVALEGQELSTTLRSRFTALKRRADNHSD